MVLRKNRIIKDDRQLTDEQRSQVFVDIYNQKQWFEKHPPKANYVKEILSNTFIFLIAVLVPIAGLIIYILRQGDRRDDAIYPLVGFILGAIAGFIMTGLPLIRTIF